MGILCVNGRRFELPEALSGSSRVVTAVKRGTEFVDLCVEGGRGGFDHPAMQRLLTNLRDSPERSPVEPLVRDVLAKVEATVSADHRR